MKAMDVQTGQTREVGELIDQDGEPIGYVSRAIRVGPRDLVLGIVGRVPSGIVHLTLDEEWAEGPHQQSERRYWG
jgi:hypothetical protein